MITVRAATHTDLPELSRLWYEKMALQQQADKHFAFMPDARSKWAEAAAVWLQDKHCSIYAAESDGGLLGYIIGWVQDAPPGLLPDTIGTITDLMVDAHSQRSGVGRLLLQTIRQWFSNQDIQYIVAHVPARLAVEQAFWQAQGMAEWTNIVWLK